MLWSSVDEVCVGHGINCSGLLHEPVEELSTALRLSTVKAEREFVEVVVEMFAADGTLVSPQEPALEQ